VNLELPEKTLIFFLKIHPATPAIPRDRLREAGIRNLDLDSGGCKESFHFTALRRKAHVRSGLQLTPALALSKNSIF